MSQLESVDPQFENISAELDAFLATQGSESGDKPHVDDLQAKIESLYGENAWDTVLDHIDSDPTLTKYLECVPSSKVFNRKGLEKYNERGAYEHLHPAFEKQLLSVVEKAVNEELRAWGFGYDSSNSSQSRMCDLALKTQPILLKASPLETRASSENIAKPREINDGEPNKAAFVKFGGLLTTSDVTAPKRGISFWITLQSPTKARQHHGGAMVKVLNLRGESPSYDHSILGSDSSFGHLHSAKSLLISVDVAVRSAIKGAANNIKAYGTK